MPNRDPQTLIDAIEATGREVREDYSGRGMYGARCVGVEIDNDAELWQLARDLIDIEDLPPPKIDSMGRRLIAYWPSFKIIDDAA